MAPLMLPRLNIPPITRILLIALLFQSFISLAIHYKQWAKDRQVLIPYLTLVPSLAIRYPWVFLTTTLVESNVFTLCISAFTLYHGARYLERAWGSKELVKFLVIVSLVPNLLTFATMIFLFALTADERWGLTTVAGGVPLQISFLIAFSQLVPAHTVTLFRGLVSLRVPRFPLIYILAITLLCLTPILTAASFFLAAFAFLVSWTYLRFYKTAFPDLDASQPSNLRGDASETFALAEFFPDPVRGPIAKFSNIVYNILVALRICTPFSAASGSAGRGEASMYRAAPGSTRAETERRRALALKALDQRLQAASASAGPATAKPPQPATGAAGEVLTQPKVGTQTAMTSQPTSMLGETSYVPDREDGGH